MIVNTVVIAKYVLVGGVWLLVSYVAYLAKNGMNTNKDTKLKVMSCRKQVRQFKKLDDADKNTLW
ncbi:MAG: hypothetical protein RR851_02755 [Clostridium sp.]